MGTKNFSLSDDDKKLEILEVSGVSESQTAPAKGKSASTVKNVNYTIEISWKTIAMILGVGAAIYLGFKLLIPLVILFFAFALTSAVLPMVRGLMKRKVPKVLSIVIVYLGLLLLIGLFGLAMAQPLSDQVENISKLFNSGFKDLYSLAADIVMVFWKGVEKEVVIESIQDFFTKDLTGVLNNSLTGAGKAVDTVAGIGTFFAYFIFSIVISVYFVADHDNFMNILLLRIVDERKSALVRSSIERIETQLGMWLRGQAILCLIIGVATYIFLSLIGVPYALPLAIIAGISEAIPTVGAAVAVIPAMLVALFALSPGYAVVVAIGYVLIQWLQNNLIIPRVMGEATGLKPVVVILAVFIGITVFGVAGAILAVPVAVIIKILADFYSEFRKITAES